MLLSDFAFYFSRKCPQTVTANELHAISQFSTSLGRDNHLKLAKIKYNQLC